MNTFVKKEAGQFRCSSSMWVTDPCYKPGTWCQHKLEKVASGDWKSYVLIADSGSWGKRVAELIAYKGDEVLSGDPRWEIARGVNIGVDSGQAGFFSGETSIGSGEYGEVDTFYGACCAATNGKNQSGIINNQGVVSHSGFGDGSYLLFTIQGRGGKVIATKLVFLDEEDLEE